MKFLVATLLFTCVQAIKPVLNIKDSCGINIAKPTECFVMRETLTNKWVTTGISSNKKWLALSNSTASVFAFKSIEPDTTSSLGCRVHYIMIDGQWSTLNDDRGFFSAASSGVVVIPYRNAFGSRFASMITQNSDLSYSLYSGTGSCDGHGCTGLYVTRVNKDSDWLQKSESVNYAAAYEIFAQEGVDCTKIFTLDNCHIQRCDPTKRLPTVEMKTECKNV